MDDSAWQAGFPSAFDAQFGQTNEDWEDWLRWDPAADNTSTTDQGVSLAGSSKNDSPVQDPVFPAPSFDENIAPPMIVGDEGMDFTNSFAGDGAFNFGNGDGTAAGFDFGLATPSFNAPAELPKADANDGFWSQPQNTGLDSNLQALNAFNNDQTFPLPSNAGPATATTPSLHHSPESSTGKRTSLSSQTSPDPPKKKGGRKRKAEVEKENEAREENGDSQDGDEPPVKKTSHNVIEKRYRNNLNDKIVELRNSVPALRAQGRNGKGDDSEDLGGLAPAHKLNKATVMAKATEYIKHLEKRNQTMQTEMDALKARLTSVEAAIGKSRDRQASMSNTPPSGTVRPREMSTASQAGLQNYLNVPGSMQQQQYMQQQGPLSYNRPPNPPAEAQNQPQFQNGGGNLMNKVMLGSMAGLMAMEGYSESQSSDSSSYGMGAAPGIGNLFKRGSMPSLSTPAAFARQATIPFLKMILVFGAVVYLLAPLFTFTPRKKEKARPSLRLPQAPSLASPLEVRQKAWLTALQSVWIPKHFLLEVVAVTAKSIKLAVRRLIGAETFQAVTGANKEEEAARIKAWDIAIDAQLAGGDAEVSYYRLLLTLMASGTLPDSPTRLVQKAVHFRVFFWEVANAGYGNLVMFKQFTEHVGKIYWDSARKQQKELLHARSQGRPNPDADADSVDLLPDHLARLVELDCDEVLSDETIQRAWNLAWNKPSAHGLARSDPRDSVVEDHAIRSPLDAVAAWYANILVDDTLADALDPRRSKWDMEYYLGLAISVAPPASATQYRALAAKAVLSNSNRRANLLAALEHLPVASAKSPTLPSSMNLVDHGPVSPEVRTALTLAKLLEMASASSPPRAREAAARALADLRLPPACFTLLTAVGAFRVLQTLASERRRGSSPSSPSPPCSHDRPVQVKEGEARGLEDLACSLRIWVGTAAGRRAGLGRGERGRVVEVCLGVARKVGGWEVGLGEGDSGYGSVGSREGSPVRC